MIVLIKQILVYKKANKTINKNIKKIFKSQANNRISKIMILSIASKENLKLECLKMLNKFVYR